MIFFPYIFSSIFCKSLRNKSIVREGRQQLPAKSSICIGISELLNECRVQRVKKCWKLKCQYYCLNLFSWKKLHFSRSIDTYSTAKSLIHVLTLLSGIHIESHPFYILCTLCNILIKCIKYLWYLFSWFYILYFFRKCWSSVAHKPRDTLLQHSGNNYMSPPPRVDILVMFF